MTVLEAALWAIGSALVLGLMLGGVQVLAPRMARDIGVFSFCQIIAYVPLLLAMKRLYFPERPTAVVMALGAGRAGAERPRFGRVAFYPIALVLGVAIHLPTDALYDLALTWWPAPSTAEELFRGFGALPLWRQVLAGVGLVITTPLIEEVYFRGALFGAMRRRYGPVVVVIATSVLFSFVHGQPQMFLPIAIVGAALAFLRVASGSIWPGVLLHMTFNGVVFHALSTASGSPTPEAEEHMPLWLVLGGTAVSAGLLALIAYLRPRAARQSAIPGPGEPGVRPPIEIEIEQERP